MTKLERIVVRTEKASQPIGAYSQAVRVKTGDLLFVAGQVAIDIEGHLVGEGDVASQTKQVFENIHQILRSVDAYLGNVVEFTTYVVGKENIQPYLRARMEIFSNAYPDKEYPANTLLVVEALVREELLIEIKAVAILT